MAGVPRRWPYSPLLVRPSGADTLHTYTQAERVQKSPDCTTKKNGTNHFSLFTCTFQLYYSEISFSHPTFFIIVKGKEKLEIDHSHLPASFPWLVGVSECLG